MKLLLAAGFLKCAWGGGDWLLCRNIGDGFTEE